MISRSLFLRNFIRRSQVATRLARQASAPSTLLLPLDASRRYCRTSASKRPVWVQQILDDKRTFFEDVSHVERSFLTGVQQNDERRCFTFSFDNAPDEKYRKMDTAFVALRQTCRCGKCFAFNAQQKKHVILDADLDIKPANVDFDRENQLLHVTWSDGHRSAFSGPWIYATFTPHKLLSGPPKRLWTAKEYWQNFQSFDFEEVCTQPEVKLNFLQNLSRWGLVKITNAPKEKNGLANLAAKINYVKTTHYGQYFEVENKPVVTNLAYNHSPLQPHVDQPFFEYLPGSQFLHCIRQANKGGDSIFADGFAVAEYLRENEKENFEALTTIPWNSYNYASDEFEGFLMQRRTPVTLNPDGSYKLLHFNHHTMDSMRQLSAEQQSSLLKGFKRFVELLESPEFQIKFKLAGGEIAAFDNIRVTHSREGFGSNESRYFIGCYLDWDELFSRARLLQCELFREKIAKKWPEM